MDTASSNISIVEIDERRGVVSIDGQRVRALRPGFRAWKVFLALARADGAPVDCEDICRALGTTSRRQSIKDLSRDMIRRLRDVFEALRDYDTKRACLVIRETKFGKSRLVPLSASARRIVDSYLRRRRDLGLSCGPLDSLRCCPGGHRATSPALQMSLDRLMRGCGLKPARGRGPRNHDLRHTFAVHRVLDWYRHGKNVQALLPHLVTYMGHRDLASTQQYLFLTSDVLHEASALFECFATASCGRVQS